MNNRQVAEIFLAIADLLEIKGESVYKVLAYRKAGEAIQELGTDLRQIWQEGELQSIPGVGKAIAEKIDELYQTGKLDFYETLVAEVPLGLVEVLAVGDVGPKKAARFWRELGIETIADLERAARAGELQKLSGMGAKSEARILENIKALQARETERMLLDKAWRTSEELLERLRLLPGVARAEAAGSLRRYRETIGDLDLIVASSVSAEVIQAFTSFPQVARTLGKGETKASVELHDGTRVQVWVHPPERFGSAFQYASGSQAHNVRLRERALRSGLSLSEHGYKKEDGSEITCSEESQVYAELGLPWIPPELREDRGEIDAAEAGELPVLVDLSEIQGELHAHSDWSDGAVSMEEMLQAGVDSGLSYFVISDHSRSLGIANGLSLERLEDQRKQLAPLRRKFGEKILILHGAEVEILADGSLDYPDEVLAELDIVIASLHTSLKQPREVVTERLLKVISNPHVDIIGHPTGRLLNSRAPADLEMEPIIEAASAHQVALEINSNPERLDLRDVHARMAVEAGCLLAIDTDAHHPDHLGFRHFGVGTARRAWVTRDSVINTWPAERLMAWLTERPGR